jgi:hypothetical protein
MRIPFGWREKEKTCLPLAGKRRRYALPERPVSSCTRDYARRHIPRWRILAGFRALTVRDVNVASGTPMPWCRTGGILGRQPTEALTGDP